MSSTTEHQRGQALAVFSISMGTLIVVAALAFDAGIMILERRDQQNAADAAAIAAARYVVSDPTRAIDAAVNIAAANGYSHGAGMKTVAVNIPPTSGPNAGKAGHVEVVVGDRRSSIFAGIFGVTGWDVGARAVAVNQEGAGGSFSFLSLHSNLCDSMLVSGNGSVVAFGNIQVNSSCQSGALRRQGNGNITVDVPGGACNVVGTIADGGGQGIIQCVQNQGAPVLPDPLRYLPAPAMPVSTPSISRLLGSLLVPLGCPGSAVPATIASPQVCQFTSSYAGTTWRLYPGLYPGGLKLQGGTFYLEPGVYYIGGGGITISGTGTRTVSVDPGGTTGPAGGVMFYNAQLPGSPVGPIVLNGSSADIDLRPLDDGSRYAGLQIFQDRTLDINGDDVTINGSTSDMEVRGTIYVPAGDVKTNGSAGTLILDQIVAKTYKVNGASGSIIKALKEQQYIVKLDQAGLVE